MCGSIVQFYRQQFICQSLFHISDLPYHRGMHCEVALHPFRKIITLKVTAPKWAQKPLLEDALGTF